MTVAAIVTRAVAEIAGITGAFLAYPHLGLMLLAAAILAAFPRTVTPTVLMVGVALVWLVQTGLHPHLLTVTRLDALALALYFLHTASALAAVLPRDGHAAAGLLRPWLTRAGVVTVLTVATTLMVASMRSVTGTTATGTGGWIAELALGLVLAVGAGVFLVHLGRRG